MDFELTHPQQRIWLVERLYPGTPLHHLAGVVTFDQVIDFALLEAAFNRFVEVYDAPRVRVAETSLGVRQRIEPHEGLTVPLRDFGEPAPDAPTFESWVESFTKTPFEPGARLFRVAFFRLSAQRQGYVVCFHHLVADGWSFQILAEFIGQAYAAAKTGASPPSPSGPSYHQLAEEERAYLASERAARSREFWLAELSGVPLTPADTAGTSAELLRVEVPARIAQAAHRYAQRLGVSIASLFNCLVMAALSRQAGTSDVVLGVPLANRAGARRRSFGMLASTLPLRAQLRPGEPLDELVQRVHATTLRCLRHQRYPFDLIVRALPGLGGSAQLVHACVNYYNTRPQEAARLESTPLAIEERWVGHQLFPLYLVIKEWAADGALELRFGYKPAALAASTAARFLDALVADLERMPNGLQLDELRVVGSLVPATEGMSIRGAARAPTLERGEPLPVQGQLGYALELFRQRGKQERAAHTLAALWVLASRMHAEQAPSVLIGGAGGLARSAAPLTRGNVEPLSVGQLLEQAREVLCQLGPASARLNAAEPHETDVFELWLDGLAAPSRGSAPVAFELHAEGARVRVDLDRCPTAERERGLSRLARVLEQLRDPTRAVAELEVVSEQEQSRLLTTLNATERQFAADKTVLSLFSEQVRLQPEARALLHQGRTFSYSWLNDRASRLASTLRARGVARGDVVAVLVPRSPDLIVAIYATISSGAAYLPLDVATPSSRVETILRDSGARALVTTTALATSALPLPALQLVCVDSPESYGEPIASEHGPAPTDVAYVCYTSGSTGTPKGVMIEHRSLVNRLQWMQRAYQLVPSDVLLQKTSIAFDVSVWEVFWWAIAGAGLSLAEPGEERSPASLIDRIERDAVTVTHFVPSMLQAFVNHVEESGSATRLRSLRRLIASGEALSPRHVTDFARVFGSTGAQLTNLYGPTEATIDVTHHECRLDLEYRNVPIGRPIDNTWLRVLGPTGRLQPVGMVGELYLGGVGVARGYLNRSDLTRERFVPDPYQPGERLYRTGDLARWNEDGEVEYFGRTDDQIKLRGFRIELGEVEATLRSYPGLVDGVAAVQGDTPEHRMLCAYVVLRPGGTLDAVRQFLAERLPEAMVPTYYGELESLPLGPTGKVDRKALPAPTGRGGDDPPQGEVESKLAEAWREVLAVASVGANENFFSLGGDSIKVISLLAAAKRRALRIETEQVYQAPTIRGLAALAVSAAADDAISFGPFDLVAEADRSLLPASAEAAYPLTELQLGLIYQSQIMRETPFYHDVFSYRVHGRLDEESFSQAVQALCRRHAMLRTTFHLTGVSEPLQVVHRSARNLLNVVDLRGLAASEQSLAIDRYVAAIKSEEFDLSEPRLVGFHVHRLSDDEYLYTIDFHDSALDGWSVNLLHRELFERYHALLRGEALSETPGAVHFRDYVGLERAARNSADSRAFWQEKLAGSSVTELPRLPRTAAPAGGGVGYLEVPLPSGVFASVKAVAARLGLPPKTLLLAVHVWVTSVVSGERDVLTGYEYGGRPGHGDAERVVGLFLNTLPLRASTAVGSWSELASQLYAAEVAFLPHRRYPMAHIKRDLGVRGPLFDTVFNFTHFHVLSELRRLPGFELMDVEVRAETEFPLRAEVSVHPFTDELMLWIHYHREAFPEEQVRRLGGYYARALEALLRNPAADPADATLLSSEERRFQLEQLTQNRRALPERDCFPQLFEARVARHPSRIAVECGPARLTFRELDAAADRVAGLLRDVGASGQVVATAMPRGVTWMVAVIGCLKAGGVYLPLDLEHPAERTRTFLSRSQCRVLLVEDDRAAGDLDAMLRQLGDARPQVLPLAATLLETGAATPVTRVAPADDAYVIFTSGSTGVPKGAVIRHQGMLNHLLAKEHDLQLGEHDVIVQNASQCFDISVWQLLAGPLVGARTVIYPNDWVRDVERLLSQIAGDESTILELVPSHLAVVLNSLEAAPRTFPRLRYLLVTGEPVQAELLQRWFRVLPDIPVVNAYGPTEAADDICHHVMRRAPVGPIVPVGKPIQNLNVYVVNERLGIVPLGTKGEVVVSGVGVGRGYINDPERTASVFTKDPFFPDRDLYRTGDVGRWLPDGVLELAGRRDEQVKIRGHRIELGEVESQLSRAPGIAHCAVIPDAAGLSLVAFYVGDVELDVAALKLALSARLPEYMIPGRFVALAELPLSSNGKVDKRTLAARIPSLPEQPRALAPLLHATEHELARLWADILGVPIEQIGSNSDFFELGGHSLKAMQLSLRSERRLSINDVFTSPQLGKQAQLLKAVQRPDATAPSLLVSIGSRPPRAEVALVGFSYAGGNAVNFKAMFDALGKLDAPVACYAVELPRPGEGDLHALAARAAQEIQSETSLPVVLWGHCSGSALTLEVAQRMERAGAPLLQVFIGGKVIHSRPMALALGVARGVVGRFVTVDVTTMSTAEIKQWMIKETGFEGFAALSEHEVLAVTEAFRQDAARAARYFDSAFRSSSSHRLRAPILNVVARDDRLTRNYQRKHANWSLFSSRVELCVLDDGGHYFIKTRPEQTAKIVIRALRRFQKTKLQSYQGAAPQPHRE